MADQETKLQLCDENGVYTEVGAAYAERLKKAVRPIIDEMMDKGATVAEAEYIVKGCQLHVLFRGMMRQ